MIKKNILGKIKDCRIAKDSKTLAYYTTIIGEMDRVAKEPTEDQQMAVIKKMAKDANTCGNLVELSFLNEFLPTFMTDDEIRISLKDLDASNLGEYMKAWNSTARLKGKADMKLVSKIVRDEFLG